MWLRLVGQVLARRMDALALALQNLGHGVLGQPVDLEVRVELAELAGDRDVSLRVSQADRRGDVERALAARSPAGPGAGPGGAGSTKSRSSRLTLPDRGPAGCGPSLPSSPGRRRSSRRAPRRSRGAGRRRRVRGPRGPASGSGPSARARCPRPSAVARAGSRERLGVGLEGPADRVLALLGRVRLGEDLARRRTRGSPRSARASSACSTSPSPHRTRAASTNACSARRRGGVGAAAGPAR